MADHDYKCVHCGADFTSNQPRAMYCSKRRKVAAWRGANPDRLIEHRLKEAKPEKKHCFIFAGHCCSCGSAFVARRKRLYCSTECQPSAEYISIAPPVRTCRGCGKCFVALNAKTAPKQFCGQACRDSAHQSHKRTARLRRKAAQRSVQVESVNPFKVFDRDGWRCKLCGVRTPKSKRGTYDKNAPELDHIIPLAKGGQHSYLNTQCSCRACNGAKSDKAMGQLLLIG